MALVEFQLHKDCAKGPISVDTMLVDGKYEVFAVLTLRAGDGQIKLFSFELEELQAMGAAIEAQSASLYTRRANMHAARETDSLDKMAAQIK